MLPNIVIVGAGPIGLVTAIELANKEPTSKIVILERHAVYKREQRLRLDTTLIKNENILQNLAELVDQGKADREDATHLDIPIQELENCLLKVAKSLPIEILQRQFVTVNQYQKLLAEHNVHSRQELEKKLGCQIVLDVAEIEKSFPDCKIIIGADGSRSAVRELLVQDEEAVTKKDLRNLIELKYQVYGKVEKLSLITTFLTQPLLNGFLCGEHVKYDEDSKRTSVTLRFLVDKGTYDNPLLDKINAKNLLLLTTDIPTKLRKAINVWLNTRADQHIIPGTPKLNKTTLSIYTSKNYANKIHDKPILLVGDSSCGFPFMNGLNLGIENSSHLVSLIAKNWVNLNDKRVLDGLIKDYSDVTQQTFLKGTNIVARADFKYSLKEASVTSMYVSSYPIKMAVGHFKEADHPIFLANNLLNLDRLNEYVKTIRQKSKKALAENLQQNLMLYREDPAMAKKILLDAYIQNQKLEESRGSKYSSFYSSKGDYSYKLLSSKEEDNVFETIPKKLKSYDGSILNSNLHNIIYDLNKHVCEYEVNIYQENVRESVKQYINNDKTVQVIQNYLF